MTFNDLPLNERALLARQVLTIGIERLDRKPGCVRAKGELLNLLTEFDLGAEVQIKNYRIPAPEHWMLDAEKMARRVVYVGLVITFMFAVASWI